VVASFDFPKVEVVGRGAATATDTASTESAMLEFAEKMQFGHMVLIQATSPLLTSRDVDEAIERFEREGADSLVSVVPQKRFTWTLDDSGRAVPTNYDPLARPRRQDFSPYYVENGALYISAREGLLCHRCRLFGRVAAYVMAEETFHEIDEPVDFSIIEAFLEERSRQAYGSFAERAQRIKLVLSDVDGVLTDSGMYYSETGDELKKFNTRDGKAFELLRNAGIRGGIITSENTKLVERRAQKLKLDVLIQGAKDKLPALALVMAETGLSAEEIAFVGDDLADEPVLRRVGLGACPADAIAAAKRAATYVCEARGGDGCVREFVEKLLDARGSRT
jgi:N-acylneuraminate cytidylyltransferase